jgi:hypothetical protein
LVGAANVPSMNLSTRRMQYLCASKEQYGQAVCVPAWYGNTDSEDKRMNTNSLIAVGVAVAGEGVLWAVAPGLATVVGVMLALFVVGSWREGVRSKQPRTSMKFNVEDFQRRLAA